MPQNAPFDLQPVLDGRNLLLRPLQPDDFEALYAVASDPLIWEQHPDPTRYQRKTFETFFATGLASGGALVVTDKASGDIIGTSRYYDWNPAPAEIAIGYTFIARACWGGETNREMKQLMLGHAFRQARLVWFHVGKNNWRSRKAMEKIGGQFSHEAAMEFNGALYDHVYYIIPAPEQTAADRFP